MSKNQKPGQGITGAADEAADPAQEAAESAPVVASVVPQAEPETDFELSLGEFCARRSMKDRRVELIAAFHHVELAAGRVKARESEFTARLDALGKQPV